MKILAVGDIVGSAGINELKQQLKGIKEKEKFFPFLEYHFYIYTKDGKYVISTIDKDYEGKSFNKLSRAGLVDDSYIVSVIICKHCNDYIIQIENCEV